VNVLVHARSVQRVSQTRRDGGPSRVIGNILRLREILLRESVREVEKECCLWGVLVGSPIRKGGRLVERVVSSRGGENISIGKRTRQSGGGEGFSLKEVGGLGKGSEEGEDPHAKDFDE